MLQLVHGVENYIIPVIMHCKLKLSNVTKLNYKIKVTIEDTIFISVIEYVRYQFVYKTRPNV